MGVEVKSMEMKKPQSSSIESALTVKKARNFVAEIKSEIFKINWTSREELIVYTKIVILMAFIFGMSIYFLDLLIQGTLSGMSFLLRLIGG